MERREINALLLLLGVKVQGIHWCFWKHFISFSGAALTNLMGGGGKAMKTMRLLKSKKAH